MCQVSSQSIAVPYPEKSMVGVVSPPSPRQRLRGENTLVGTGLIDFIEPSDTLITSLFLKKCILQTILNVFLLFIFVRIKTDRICLIWFWGDIRCYRIKGSMFLVLFV